MDSPAPPRALLLLQELTMGGAALLAIRLMRRLLAGHAVDVLVIGACSPELLGRIPDGVRVHRLDQPTCKRQLRSAKHSLLPCVEWAAAQQSLPPFSERYDVLLSISILWDWRGCIAHDRIRTERKFLFLIDEALQRYPSHAPVRKAVLARTIAVSSAVVTVSESLWRAMAAACPPLRDKPFYVLHSLLDEAFLRGKPQERPDLGPSTPLRVLTVARLSPGKRVIDCARVHARLIESGVNITWDVIGDGPEHAAIQAEISHRAIGTSFTLHPPDSDIADWMRRADVLVLFSASEGCPTVIIEALHMGCAVVTTGVHGIEPFVRHRENGLVVAHEPAALTEALRELATEPSLLARLRQKAAQTPVQALVDRHYAAFAAALQAPRQRSATPQVSILIPTYNQANRVGKAIASALQQDFASLEVVVLDDHSGDDTQDTCRPWLTNPRLRYARNPHNLGRVANYRKGLYELARGEWVVMLDGDDYLTDPTFVSTAWQLAQRHASEGVVFVQAGQTTHYADGSRADRTTLPAIEETHRLLPGSEYFRLVLETGVFSHLGLFYNRQVAIAHEAYRADISSSDMESFLRIALAGRVILLNRSVGHWVQHGANTSSMLPAAHVAENVRIFRDIARHGISTRTLRRFGLGTALWRHQAHALGFLYRQALRHEDVRPTTVTTLLREIASIHPTLLVHRKVGRLLGRTALRALRNCLP